jgi:HD-like signal output (HDOD) protein
MDANELKRLIYSRVEELPTLPTILPRVIDLVDDKTATVEQLTRIVAKDQALTSKVLKVANSAYYGFSGEINSLQHAVSLLGFNMVKSITLSIGVLRALPSDGVFRRFSQQGLWVHSLAVATSLKQIGAYLDIHREELFTIGLLHDVGIIVQVHYFTDMFRDVLTLIYDQGMDQLQAEREVFCCDHGEISQMVLERWHFPPQIVLPISLHHKEAFSRKTDDKTVAMLRIANALPTEIKLGRTGLNYTVEVQGEDMEILGLNESDITDLRQQLASEAEEIRDFTRIITP